MPKMKSNRAAKKRFKLSATGKVKRGHSHAGHKFTSKSPDRKRHLRKAGQVVAIEARRIQRMLLG